MSRLAISPAKPLHSSLFSLNSEYFLVAIAAPLKFVEGSHKCLEIIRRSHCSGSVSGVSSVTFSFCVALVILTGSATIASISCRGRY